ncbi:MAG: hypothetical protein EBE86_023955 [Hormoscilla sp. GUM202]|nr:hypothetical protein [Hormoscilla sp. GUM202]
MVAAQILDFLRDLEINCIYRSVTTGRIWKFLQLGESNVYIERGEHYLENLEFFLGILSHIVQTTRPKYNLPL